MIKQKYTSHGDYFSVFTPRQSKQKVAQERVSGSTKSQFFITEKHRGTSVFICMDARRKYKYNDK